MVLRSRTPLTLVGGIAIGLLIGGYVHTADAGTDPCTNPKLPVPPPGKVLSTYNGDTVKTKPDEIDSYRNEKKFTYRGSITIYLTATQIDPKKNASGSAFVESDVTSAVSLAGPIAIAPGDNPTQTFKITYSAADNQCKFGCWAGITEPSNVRWQITVTK